MAAPPPTNDLYHVIEEEYEDEPFQLLVVCVFLNRTPGYRAIPKAREFLARWPDAERLARAQLADVEYYFQTLGLQRQRSKRLVLMAQTWLADPPKADCRRCKTYKGEVTAYSEVAHLPGVGPYASDAWRIFCRDKLYHDAGRRGFSPPLSLGPSPHREAGPEWKRVVPTDKELRKHLQARWRAEGYLWDPHTGKAELIPKVTAVGATTSNSSSKTVIARRRPADAKKSSEKADVDALLSVAVASLNLDAAPAKAVLNLADEEAPQEK